MEQQYSREFLEAYQFKTELTEIVTKPLSPENIDSYADDALSNLIQLVQKTTREYDARPTVALDTPREKEEAAFSYFGLQNIEAILDHVAEKSDETHSLDAYIAGIEKQERIILPPDTIEPNEVPAGSSEATENRIIPRLKTLLFVLTNHYDIDLNDKKDISIITGVVDPSMMRSESYYSVTLPSLKRQVLINNEVGNATYLFNTEHLARTPDTTDLLDKTKNELNKLLTNDPHAGQRIIYSPDYVVDLIAAIDEPITEVRAESPSAVRKIEVPLFLLPDKAPEGWLTMTGVMRKFGVSFSPINNIFAEYAEEIGETTSYKTKGRRGIVPYYSEAQQAVIERALNERQLLNGKAPEGYKNLKALAEEWDVSSRTINQATTALADQIGDITIYQLQSKGAPRPFYSPEQIDILHSYLDANGFLKQMPEDYVFMRPYAKQIGVADQSVEKAMADIVDFGEVESYWATVRFAKALSPDQQSMVYNYLKERGFFDLAPAGYLPQAEFMKLLGVDHHRLKAIIAHPDLDIGEIEQFRYGKHVIKCFSPVQQKAITAFAHERKLGIYHMPEGYKSIGAIAEGINMSHSAVGRAVAAIRDELGDVTTYTSGFNNVEGFSPAQQARIMDQLYKATGFGKQPVPDGYITFQKFARSLHVSDYTLQNIIHEVPDFGKVEVFANCVNNKVRGISPLQQAFVRSYLGRS